ncbi:MAG: bifunctional diaminohydroxyphosphoribosylaminopyrimidine deaminase/5-amino-6-(5-phosphoribosylamino)uracil reductase RibD [Bradyrhizobiaceae bacterium]|nr:bifunctional diaminohydroxyphosphoribosylaminopyrimidine deaminase/5-amino-6-(5-phosphoribosylamino)uracil reductase RibD [Bradyrhizobiaceae bacterium]
MSAHARVEEAPVSLEEWDRRLMAAAHSIGRRNLGQAFPNPAVGALIVRFENGQPVIIARGCTAVGGRPHAETEALRIAGEAARGATTYVTLEPCAHHGKTPPCADAIVNAGIKRAVIAIEDPNPEVKRQGVALLRAAGIEVVLGVGEEEARITHAGHFRRMIDGRPHVILKIAVSADGKTALAGRRPAEISCPESRAEAHMLRATSDAVLVGSGTAVADDPLLTCRLPGMAGRSPIRIVLDGKLLIRTNSKLVRTAREVPVWVLAGRDAPAEAEKKLTAAGVEVLRVKAAADGRVDLLAALRRLAERGLTRVLVEGGPVLSAMLVRADLVDEAVVVRSPRELGPNAINALEAMPLGALTGSPKLKVIERRMAGVDTYTRYFRS